QARLIEAPQPLPRSASSRQTLRGYQLLTLDLLVLTLRIAAASVNQIPLDWEGNRRRLVDALRSARQASAVLICLPELAVTGYGCEDMFFSVGVQQRALEELASLLPHTKGMLVAVGLPLFYESSLYNAAALLSDGKLLGIVCKQFMASDG